MTRWTCRARSTLGGIEEEKDNFSETSYRAALTYIVNDEVSTCVSTVEANSPSQKAPHPD